MSVLISDTSVLIDLERAHLIEAVFTLPMRFGCRICCSTANSGPTEGMPSWPLDWK